MHNEFYRKRERERERESVRDKGRLWRKCVCLDYFIMYTSESKKNCKYGMIQGRPYSVWGPKASLYQEIIIVNFNCILNNRDGKPHFKLMYFPKYIYTGVLFHRTSFK